MAAQEAEFQRWTAKNGRASRPTREDVMTLQAAMREEGREISIRQLCRILGVARSTFYYVSHRAGRPAVDEGLAQRIWSLIQSYPAYGIRKVWAVLRYRLGVRVNRKRVARMMRLKGWTMKQRRPRMRPRVRCWPSRAEYSNQRWATDVTHIYCGQDGWCHMLLVIDCAGREIIGWRLSKSGRATVAEAALEDALIRRFGPGAQKPNGVAERVFRTLKEECAWLHRFESRDQAEREITRWIEEYNTWRPHESLGWMSPTEWRRSQEQAA